MGAGASSSSHSGAPITMTHHHHHDTTQQGQGVPPQSSAGRSASRSNSYREHHHGGGGDVANVVGVREVAEGGLMSSSVGGGVVSSARSPGSHLMINRPEPITSRQQTHVLSYDTVGMSASRSTSGNARPIGGVSGSVDDHGVGMMFTTPIEEGGKSKSSSNLGMFAPNHGGGLAGGEHGSSGNNALCLNPASELNSRLDTQVEIKVYPCNNSSHGNSNSGRKKCTQFIVKPEGVIIQGTNRPPSQDIGTEYSRHIGRKLPRYELSDTRASQLLITSHQKNYYVIPAPEAFSRHSGTCRLLGDRKHNPCNHNLKVGDFLRVGSVGVVVIETHNGTHHESMSEERIQRIMQDTTVGGYVDAEETDLEDSSDVETAAGALLVRHAGSSLPTLPSPTKSGQEYDVPTCYMCFDDEDTQENPLISPCKCKGDTQFVHVDCLRKWHTAEADNQICFLSTVDATCSVCKSTFKSDFRLKSGHLVKLFQSSLEPPYVSLLIATKHEMAQRLFNTRFQLSFKTLMKPDGKNATRPLLLGRSSGSDMVLDYRTVSARHATIKFKNGEFVFSDAGSSNGSYLYVRQPVELCPNAPSVQFRLGRSMISMKVVNKWNRRLLRAVTRRSGGHTPTFPALLSGGQGGNSTNNSDAGDHNPGSMSDINNSAGGGGEKKTRESILRTMPSLGMLDQQSSLHLDLIYALAIPKRELISKQRDRTSSTEPPVDPSSDIIAPRASGERELGLGGEMMNSNMSPDPVSSPTGHNTSAPTSSRFVCVSEDGDGEENNNNHHHQNEMVAQPVVVSSPERNVISQDPIEDIQEFGSRSPLRQHATDEDAVPAMMEGGCSASPRKSDHYVSPTHSNDAADAHIESDKEDSDDAIEEEQQQNSPREGVRRMEESDDNGSQSL